MYCKLPWRKIFVRIIASTSTAGTFLAMRSVHAMHLEAVSAIGATTPEEDEELADEDEELADEELLLLFSAPGV